MNVEARKRQLTNRILGRTCGTCRHRQIARHSVDRGFVFYCRELSVSHAFVPPDHTCHKWEREDGPTEQEHEAEQTPS